MKLNTLLTSAATLGLAITAAQAASININFIDGATAGSSMLSTDTAGLAGVAGSNWNNYDSGAASGPLNNDAGTATTATVTTTGGLGDLRLGHTATSGDDKMWKGFFETDNTAATIGLSGLTYSTYDVYVYFDGANDDQWRTATYTIGGTSFTVEDSENTNWGTGQNVAKVYQLPTSGNANGNAAWPQTTGTNQEGNYIVFSGVTGTDFDLTMVGGSSAATRGAVINGMQIVDTTVVPEPSSTALLGLGGLALILRRRK